MDIIFVIAIYLILWFFVFKLAKSKNREPFIWILISIVFSPLIILLILALIPKVTTKKNRVKKRKKSK